jgi:hypothetical protein
MMVLISRLIWATETPRTAGPMRKRIRFTPGSQKSSLGRGSIPILASAGTCSASWRTPPASTAQANTIAGGSKYGAPNKAAKMKDRFSSVGVSAGIANRLQVLRTPPANETSEMKRM